MVVGGQRLVKKINGGMVSLEQLIFLVECCNELVVDWPGRNLEWHFTKMDGIVHKDLPVYKAEDSEMYISTSSQGFWIINEDYLSSNETHRYRNNNVRISLISM